MKPMMGGFIGYLQSYERNTLIENNSVSNIAINYIYILLLTRLRIRLLIWSRPIAMHLSEM